MRLTEFERPRGSRGIVPLIAAAIAAGGIRAGVGLLQGRNDVRRQRNRINDAYTFGHERQNVMQQDVRQSEAESLGRRGLDAGGDISIGGPVGTGENLGVGGAHTLGGQQQADLHREQGLEQNNLLRERNNAVSDVEAGGQQNAVNQIAAGVSTGFQVAGMGSASGDIASGIPTGTPNPTGTPMPSISGAYAQSGVNPHFNGINPTDPLSHPNWSVAGTNAGFTKYNGTG